MRNISIPQQPPTQPNPHQFKDCLDSLRFSGRWLEVTIPIDDKGNFLTIGIVYGISGSNWRDEAMVQNERLLTMAVARCLSYGDEAYLLLGDFNVNERKSDILDSSVKSSSLINLWSDRHPDQLDQPTYLQNGIVDIIDRDEVGASTLDMAYTNRAESRVDNGRAARRRRA